MSRHERRAQAARGETVACRIRARLGPSSECLFCCSIAEAETPQTALAVVYYLGHQDEAMLRGPTLCDPCLTLLRRVADQLTAAQGGVVHNMNAPGAGKA